MVYCLANNVVSPLGVTTEENYQAVKAGHSALTRYEGLWRLPEPFTAAFFSDKQKQALAIDDLTTFESLAVASIRKAIAEVEIDITAPNVVFILGSTKGNVDQLKDNEKTPNEYYLGETASRIAQTVGITTHPIVACNACISGVSAIILAMRLLEGGFYDYAVVCGADVQNKFTVSGFQSLKAVSQDPCRPFDLERLGLNLGEAAATMILSSDRLTCTSNSNAWCIESGAVRNDAFHVSSPSKNGEGARLALCGTHADTIADQLAFINAHGTATMFNDQMESVAIERSGLNSVPVNALKGYYGHTMGAAGVLETVISMCAAEDNTILATRGFSDRGVSGKILLSSENQSTQKDSFVKMISGFGGSNAALLVSKVPKLNSTNHIIPDYHKSHHVSLSPGELIIDGSKQVLSFSRLAFVATDILLQAEGKERFVTSDDRAVIMFNHSSSVQADRSYLSTIADDENCFPSPSIFVYTLPNMAVAEVAMRNLYHAETSLYILPERDDHVMQQVIRASLLDKTTCSMITGWVDYEDNDHFVADLYIIEK